MTLVAILGIYSSRNLSSPSTVTQTELRNTTQIASATQTVTSTTTETRTNILTTTSTSTRNVTRTLTTTAFVGPNISSIEVANISMRGWPGRMVVNTVTNKIYVPDLFSNHLTVIDGSTNKVVTNLTLPGTVASGGVVVNPKTNRVYVHVLSCINLPSVNNSCISGPYYAYVLVLDGISYNIVNRINISMFKMGINPNTNLIYAIQNKEPSSGSLLVINGSSRQLVANVSLGVYPVGVAVNPNKNLVYIDACQQLILPCLGAQVLGINGTTYNTLFRLPMDSSGIGEIMVNPNNNVVYVNTLQRYLNSSHSLLTSINGTSGKLIAQTRLSAIYIGPLLLTVNPMQDEIYATSYGARGYWIVDGTNYSLLNSFSVGSDAYGIAFNPNTQLVYVATKSSADTPNGTILVLGARFILLP